MQHRMMQWPDAPVQNDGSETSEKPKTGYGTEVPPPPKPKPKKENEG